MPNWTENKLTIHFHSQEIMDKFKEQNIIDGQLDFNGLLKMPEELSQVTRGATTIDGVRVNQWIKKDGVDTIIPTETLQRYKDEYGATDWYEWAKWNWGCKWNADTMNIVETGLTMYILFNTPWTEPEGWFTAFEDEYGDDVDFDVDVRYEGE